MGDLSTWKRAWSLLDARERRSAWLVLIVVVLGGLSAAVMVGSVMPFLGVLAEPSRIETVPALSWAYDYFDFTSAYSFLVALGLASFSLILLSSAIQILKTWAVVHFSMMRFHSISYRLLSNYMAQPYSFFLNHHSGEMGSRVLVESEQFVLRFLRPASELISAIFTCISIIALLVWVDPVVTAIAFFLLGGFYGLIFLRTNRVLNELGLIRVAANGARFRLSNEALSGIKDIKLLGREAVYLSRYAKPSKEMALSEVRVTVLISVPQFALQALAMGGIIVICLSLINSEDIANGAALGELLPIIGVFAFAGQRLLPELSKLYSSLATIKAGSAAVDAVYKDLVLRKRSTRLFGANASRIGLKRELVLDGISYSYLNSDHAGVRDVTLSIRAGERIGIVGSTGAGKTTLADIILGLLEPDRGRLVADGIEVTSENVRSWMLSVGYVPQDIFLIDAPVSENIAFGVSPCDIDHERIRKAARIAQIDGFIQSDLPEGYQTQIGERGIRLSGGQRQRIGIARALYNEADLIVFDEATSALDNLTEAEVMAAIDALPGEKTVLMIAHRLSTVEKCDKLLVLEKGRVVGYDSWNNLLKNNAAFNRIARMDVR